MPWEWLSWFRRDPTHAHEAVFDLNQGVIGERRAAEALKELAQVAKQNLETLQQVEEDCRLFEEQGGEVVPEAARAYREGLAALIAMPSHLFPTDGEARREAMQVPSDGSTSSQPMPVNGPPGGSSQKALPNAVAPHQADSGTPSPKPLDGQGPELPRRPRGRPKGVRNKVRQPQSTTEDQDGRKA